MPTYVEETSMNTPVEFDRPLPQQLLETYVEAAVRHANLTEPEAGRWFAEIQEFPGVWAKGDSPKAVLDELEEVLFEWVLLKIHDQDRDIPIIESLDLNTL